MTYGYAYIIHTYTHVVHTFMYMNTSTNKYIHFKLYSTNVFHHRKSKDWVQKALQGPEIASRNHACT